MRRTALKDEIKIRMSGELLPLTLENKPLAVKLFTSGGLFFILRASKEFAHMKIRIEIDENSTEDEVIIRCREFTKQVAAVQKAVSGVNNVFGKLLLYKGNTEYYLMLDEILFFETDENGISAHTRNEVYQTRYKLYELEDFLPGVFMRVSKSTILNTDHIYSIDRNLTASSVVAFQGTHKQVYVSRYYYKPLISKLEEKRLHHEK